MKTFLKKARKLQSCIAGAALIVILSAAMPALQNRTDFSGKWILNINKSEFDNIPQYAAVKQFNVRQENDSIDIERITIDANGEEATSREVVSLDGKPCTLVLSNGKSKTSSITWFDSQKEMKTVSSYSAPNNPNNIEYILSQVWSLDGSKTVLTIILTAPEYTIKCVYDKQ
jgi:hypothetical protein